MQDPLHFTTTTTINRLIPSFRLKPPISISISATLSTKPTTTTLHLPPKPPKFPSLPSPPPPQPDPISVISPPPQPQPQPQSDPDFQTKALYLDSLGLDPLSLPATTIAATSLPTLTSLLTFLSSSVGLSTRDLRRITTMCPDILLLRRRDAASVLAFLLREASVPSSSLRRSLLRRPRLLSSSVPSRLRPTLYFLHSLGLHDVSRHTHLLSCSVEDKFLPRLDFFSNLGFPRPHVLSMFRRFPALFCYSITDNLEPKFNYFVVQMGRDLNELKDFPHYFSFSLERRIKPRHQACVHHGVCLPLPVMLKLKEDQFQSRLDAISNSSMPKTSSPLWSAHHCDHVHSKSLLG